MSVESASLLRLEKTSLREQALTALRRAITTGQLPPGTHLVETELSERCRSAAAPCARRCVSCSRRA